MADQLTEKIIAAAIEVHKTLGSGLLESIYEEALCFELGLMGLAFQRQLAVEVLYKGHVIQGQRLDLLIENEVVVEVKSLRALPGGSDSTIAFILESDRFETRVITEFWREANDQWC